MKPVADGPGAIVYLIFSALSLLLAFFFFMGIGMGECLPRDGSPAMHACDRGKAFDVRGYPALVLVLLAAAPFVGRRRRHLTLLWLVAVPFLAAALLRAGSSMLI